jgi:hypothetical protein
MFTQEILNEQKYGDSQTKCTFMKHGKQEPFFYYLSESAIPRVAAGTPFGFEREVIIG